MAFNLSSAETNLFKIVNAIIQLIQGRSDSVGEVTLRAGQTTTVVTKATSAAAVNMNASSEVFFTAKTANAAGIHWSLWVSSKGQGTFTITHAVNAAADLTFGFEIRGGA